MTQKSLIGDEPSYVGPAAAAPKPVDGEIVEQLPAVVPSAPQPQGSALATLREHAMLSGSPEAMLQGLTHYKAMRDTFREWLFSVLVEGVHYGYSPGTQPKWCDANGKPCSEKDAYGTLGKGNSVVPLTSWRPKKSLYAAGADLLCEVLGARDSYESDHEGWVQAGSQAGVFCRRCTLYSRANGSVLADACGIGMGEHLGHNASLKKADKRAKVAAVLDWLSIRDLFTQDIEDGADKPLHENPTPAADAPKVQPRSQRVSVEEVELVKGDWKRRATPANRTPKGWSDFVHNATGREFDVGNAFYWTPADLAAVEKALAEDGG